MPVSCSRIEILIIFVSLPLPAFIDPDHIERLRAVFTATALLTLRSRWTGGHRCYSLFVATRFMLLEFGTMWSLEQISTEFKSADSTIKKLGDVFKAFEIHSSSIITSEQWVNLQSSFSSIMDSLHCRIAALDSIVKSVEDRQKGLDSKERELISTEESIRDRELALDDVQKYIDRKNIELDLMQKKLGSIEMSIERHLDMVDKFVSDSTEQINARLNKLNALDKSLEDRSAEMELRERKLKENDVADAVAKSDKLRHELEADASLRFQVTMDGKTLQMFLSDRFSEHESMGDEVFSALKLSNDPARLVLDAIDGFFPPHLKKGNVEYGPNVVRSTCVLMLEQLLKMKPLIKKYDREEARELASKWKEKMWPFDGDRYLVVLAFLLLVVVYDVASSFDRSLLMIFVRSVDRYPQVLELNRRLGFIKTNNVSSGASQPTLEEPPVEDLQVSSGVILSSPAPVDEVNVICANMDVNGLRRYLIEQVKAVSRERVLDALRFAPDPAGLVFDVVQGFYASSGLGKNQGGDNKIGCILLLDLLTELSPDLSPSMKEQGMKFAISWKDRIAKQGRVPLHVFGFLQFLAAYRLASSFDSDLLLSLVGNIFCIENEVLRVEQKRKLCHALGLTEKIPDLIKTLIRKNNRLRAVRCICSFNLVDSFQPVPLLKAHLEHSKEVARKKCMKGSDHISAKIAAADSELSALRVIVRCISDYELQNQFPPNDLIQRIETLGKENRLRKSFVSDEGKRCAADKGMERGSMPLNMEGNSFGSAQPPNPLPNTQVGTKRSVNASICNNQATQQQQCHKKRPKTIVQTAEASDVSREVAPDVLSAEPLPQISFLNSKPQQSCC